MRSDSRILKALEVSVSQGWFGGAIGFEISDTKENLVTDNIEVCRSRILAVARKIERREPAISHGGDIGSRFRLCATNLFKRTAIIEFLLRITFRSLKFKPTVVHCHDFYVLPVAYLVSRFFGSKLVYDAHELESQTNGISERLSWVCKKIERFCWPRIDRFITVSHSILTWYTRQYGEKSSEIVLNSPSIREALHFLSDPGLNVREQLQVDEGRLLGIYIGGLQGGRGIPKILELAEVASDQLSVIFLGEGILAETIRKHPNFGDNIFIHEPVPHERVVEFASAADFGFCLIENVSLSDYFCLPNKLFEYVFSGLRVVASDLPEISKLVQDRDLGVVVPLDNPQATFELISAITKLGRSKDSMIEFDLRGLSWEDQSRKLGELYASLL